MSMRCLTFKFTDVSALGLRARFKASFTFVSISVLPLVETILCMRPWQHHTRVLGEGAGVGWRTSMRPYKDYSRAGNSPPEKPCQSERDKQAKAAALG